VIVVRLLDIWTKELGVSEDELLDMLVRYEHELFVKLAEEDYVKRVKDIYEWMKDDTIIKSIILERVIVDFISVIAGIYSYDQLEHIIVRIKIMLDKLREGGEKSE